MHTSKLIYFAEPVDLGSIDTSIAVRALTEAGMTVFRPSMAFEVEGLPIPEVQAINELALGESHAMFAVMKAGVQSIGVPSEITTALNWGKPVVLASDLEATSYAVAGWKRFGNFRSVSLSDLSQVQGARWLAETLAELDEQVGLAGRAEAPSVVESARASGRAWMARKLREEDGAALAQFDDTRARELMVQKYLNQQRERELADEMTRADELQELLKGRRFVFKAVKPNAKLPERAYGTDAGFDLFTSDATVLKPGETTWVPTGVAADIPDGYWGMVTGRSSTKAKRGLDVTMGVIDEGYSGELLASVYNPHPHEIEIEEGERLVQLIFVPTAGPGEAVWGEIRPKPRGDRGFGSSGAGAMHDSAEPEDLTNLIDL